ncbi:hypothetical protein [Methylobacterium brachythecii]|uniref:Phage tail lysozyme domain-containing protein n=1 Tax=Methylobacterium brachythecii TaxID=1176177 RepID=A0A7W6APM3_9HYPH|nr:hypothetical protein [Methylobacterium brachythecii]MBB3905129.1 hypothetical protein [Methylobacterium brachythecii]GLS44363.1 hypothetical protein GCM10007884_23510 [Methylobacterium brachythecii]
MDGAQVYAMVSGLGDAFSDAYKTARAQRQEEEAPQRLADLATAFSASRGGSDPFTASIRQSAAPAVGDTGPAQRVPSFAGGGAVMRAPGSGGATETRFVDALRAGGLTNPNGLAAMTAYANHESGFKGSNINGSWSDPSESGAPGTSGGILSWRGDRFANMRRLTAGAADPVEAQAKFALTENPELTMALQNARSPEEANSLMANAWKFAGYNRPGGENAARLASTQAYVQKLGGTPSAAQAPTAVASAEPDAANIPAPGAQPAGFVVPGQDGGPAPTTAQGFAGFGSGASRMTPEIQSALNAAWKNPQTRSIAASMFSSMLTGKDQNFQISAIGDQPVLLDTKSGKYIAIGQGKAQTVSPGTSLVSPDGKLIYQAPDRDNTKLQSVAAGTTLFDPQTRQPVFTAPAAEKDEGAKITAQIDARKAQAAGLGLKEGTPAWSSFVGTGKIGRDQDLSATDKKAILEADEKVLGIEGTLTALKKARELSPEAYSGPFASTRGYLGSIVGLDGANKTQELDNTITAQALDSLKATFGAAPTEGERKILLDIQGSSSQSPAVRAKIYERAELAMQKRLAFERARAEDLRGGTYYKKDGASPKAVVAKGDQRTAIPDGMSAGAALAEAKAFVKANPQLKAQVSEQLRSYGIDPARLD